MVTIHPISETIPPRPDVVQPKIDPDLVSSLPEHMNPEVEQPKVVPTLVIPQISVAIESPISHIQPPEIYFGPDGEILPPGLIVIEEIPQVDTPLTPTHFGEDLYLYEYFPQSLPSSFVDLVPIQTLINSIGYTFRQITMLEPTSSVGPYVPITSAPALTTPLMFTTSPESYFHGGPMVPSGYKYLSGIFSSASSNPWTSPMSSSGILTGKPIVINKRLDTLYPSSWKYQAGPSGYIPSNTISTELLAFGEQ